MPWTSATFYINDLSNTTQGKISIYNDNTSLCHAPNDISKMKCSKDEVYALVNQIKAKKIHGNGPKRNGELRKRYLTGPNISRDFRGQELVVILGGRLILGTNKVEVRFWVYFCSIQVFAASPFTSNS